MIKREELNKLVVETLSVSPNSPKASQLYDHIRGENPGILRSEKVKGFRSFVKVINQFPDIAAVGTGVKVYTLRK